MPMKFYKCLKCGSIVAKLNDVGCPPSCCGEPMLELRIGTTDGALEKHVPVVKEDGNKVYVQVGSVAHPMEDDHYIEWIYLLTDKGSYIHFLRPHMEPRTIFEIGEGEVVLQVLEYCNKHGLYQANLE